MSKKITRSQIWTDIQNEVDKKDNITRKDDDAYYIRRWIELNDDKAADNDGIIRKEKLVLTIIFGELDRLNIRSNLFITPGAKMIPNKFGKKVIKFKGKIDGGNKTKITLHNNSRIEFERSIRCSNVDFDLGGAGSPCLEVDVKDPQYQTENQDDTDSSFSNCSFSGFSDKTALLYNGRNLLIERCTFKGKSGVGVHHYFYKILEDKADDNGTFKGANRKNRVQGTIFDLNNGHAIKIGVHPNDFNKNIVNNPLMSQGNKSGREYGDYLQFQILNCEVYNGVVCEARMAQYQTLGGFTCVNTKASGGKSGYPHILIRGNGGAVGSVMVLRTSGTTNFNGGRVATGALHISNDINMENKGALYADVPVSNYSTNNFYIIGKFTLDGNNKGVFPCVKVMNAGGITNNVKCFKNGTNEIITVRNKSNLGNMATVLEQSFY